MDRIILWLESMTMEETFLLTYGCIFAIALIAAPIIWLIEKHCDEKYRTEHDEV